ncbi:MAG: GNAT family N-acetyltransferase [archaeon]|nr:MAG: GNAT family N-acetyltransferase [archaeon]
MAKILIRKAKLSDVEDFSKLFLFTAPVLFTSLFGSNVNKKLREFFKRKNNLFSFQHTYFLELNGKVIGMALAYDYNQKKKETLKTSLLLLKYLKGDLCTRFKKLSKLGSLAQIKENEYYFSHLSFYPEFRNKNFGKKFNDFIERKARGKKIVLDTNVNNLKAIKAAKKYGYKIESKSPVLKIENKKFQFFKMSK